MKNFTLILIFMWIFTLCTDAQDMCKIRQLTSNPGREGFPTWSPTGDSIIYQFTNREDPAGENGLWIISQDGTGVRQVYRGIAEHPKWSPDGKYIIFDADTGKTIKLLPLKGGEPISFLPDTIRIQNGGLPCWSPDASQIAFIEGGTLSLCTYSFKSGKAKRIFSKEGFLPLPGCWSNDGKYILMALMDRETRKSTMWKISPNGKEREQITGHHENFYRHLALSPDGSLIVYAALEGNYLELYIIPSDGGNTVPLTIKTTGHNEGASWSPDGKKIAFNSSRSGNGDIWIMELDIKKIKEKLQKKP